MERKNLIKSGVAVACLVVASMFGFTIVHGYGGGGGGAPTPCASVVYAEWQSCSLGVQYRNVVSQSPANCQLTASQQAARVKTCLEFQDCSSVTYSAWGTCFLGVQSRNIIARAEPNCKTTPAQELARIRRCSGSVLGEKVFADGTLVRSSDGKTYVVVNEKLKYIASLKELVKYAGKEIIKVDDSIIASFPKTAVLGVKKYGEGQLIRNNNVKVYVIINGKKKHILNIPELAKYYFGKPIYHVTTEELADY
jgi:hypothetical protein